MVNEGRGGTCDGRDFLRARAWEDTSGLSSDESRGVPPPPLQKPLPEGVEPIGLPPVPRFDNEPASPGNGMGVMTAVARRRSRRRFGKEPVSREELSLLLWAAQGIRKLVRGGVAALRTVPSAGARHPFETYLHVREVEGLERGIYRYLPVEHALCCLRKGDFTSQVTEGCLGQGFAGACSVCFIWSAVPYRTEWRYSLLSPKLIALDAGHVCQNLYLAAEALGLGTCAVAAYHQARMDALVGVDGRDEFVVYVAPVGRPS